MERIIWLHNYPPEVLGSGSFMHTQFKHFEKKEVEIELVYIPKLKNPFHFLVNVFRIRNKYRQNIIHVQYGSILGFFGVFINSKKKIISLKGSDFYVLRDRNPIRQFNNSLSTLLTKISLKYYDEIIVMSNRMRSEISKKWNINNTKVITDGIDLNQFYPIEKEKVRKKLNLNNNDFIVGVGQIHKNNKIKQNWLVQNAIDELNSTSTKYLQITGIQPSEMNIWINACDVIVLTSRYEGWPNIIKEALACNVPFIATDVSDLLSITMKTEGKCMIINPEIDSIKEAIIKAKIQRNIKKDLRTLIEELSIDKNIEGLLKLYL